MPEQIPLDEIDEIIPPEAVTENDDGSVDIAMPEDEEPVETDFYMNLAKAMKPGELNQLATDLLDLIDKDKEARKKRDEQYEEGIRRTGLGDDAPGGATFNGASKVVHPVMAESCVDFAARSMKEIFPAKGPVKTKINGKVTEDQILRAKRKKDYLNWQTTTQIKEYRPELERLTTQLPLGGSQYLKFWQDERRTRCEFVPIDKVLLPFSASSLYTANRLTHVQDDVTEQLFKERVESGFYLDVNDLPPESEPEATRSEKASRKIEGKEETGYNEDGLRTIYEVTCYWDIAGKGLRPYIVHIDAFNERILAVYRNWLEDDDAAEKLDWWVDFTFIPWRGAQGIGLPHLIGGLSAALTGSLRALLDSAHINNAPTMLKLKAGRVVGQNTQVDITQVTEIEGPAGITDIRQIAMPMPFNPPSAVLAQLLDWLTNAAKGVVATAEEKIADASNTMPVGTALALIEQGSKVFSAVHARMHESQRQALKIICRLNKFYPDEEAMAKFEVTPEDFDENDDIEPVSDPNIFSEAQRFAQLQEGIKVMATFPDLKWERHAIARRSLEQLQFDDVDTWLPPEPEPVSGNPLVENAAAMRNVPVKIEHNQDHMAHARAHLDFLLSPFGAQNPLTPPQGLAQLLGHVQEHINAFYLDFAQPMIQVGMMSGLNEDQASVDTQHRVFQMTQQQAAPMIQMVAQAMQLVQQRQPQPPQDPAVAASIKIAEMENQRKMAIDNATLQAKGAEQQATNAIEQQRLTMDNMQQQFDQRLDQMRMFFEQQAESQRQQIELLKNDADNRTHQMTELLKNRDDNETALQTKLLELQQTVQTGFEKAATTEPKEPSGVDASAQLAEMQRLLGEIEKAKTQDALSGVLEGLRVTMATLAAPTEVVRGPDGKAIGTRKVM